MKPVIKETLLPSRAVQALGVLLIAAVLVLLVVAKQRGKPAQVTVKQRPARPAMVVLPAGRFQMGSADSDPSGQLDEHPRHEVEITHRFEIAETEVTQEQYLTVMGRNPSFFKNRANWQSLPVENLSFVEAAEYCNELSKKETLEPCYELAGTSVKWPRGLDCSGYRLPTEAEWEYAARGTEDTAYAGSAQASEVAWLGEDLDKGAPHTVRGKKANSRGLYDLSGNVWEWVWDGYAPYKSALEKDPIGPLQNDSIRVLRGGSWSTGPQFARVANREGLAPGDRLRDLGFRISRTVP